MTTLGTTDPFMIFVGTLAFWLAAVAGTTAAALLVFSVKNMVRAALALTTVLASVAAMYGIMGADFLAVVQLVVYIGAIMVLIIFAIFMTPRQVDEPGFVGAGQRAGALLVSALIFGGSVLVIVTEPWKIRTEPLTGSTLEALGSLMLTQYVLPFEIASLVLTAALVGAIVIARED